MRPQTFIVNQTLIIVHEHYALLCEIIKGESQAEHTERESELFSEWGERRDKGRGYGVGFYRGQLFLVSTIILNQHKIFWDIATGHICTKLFRDTCKYNNRCSRLFLSNRFSGAMTSTRITMRFSIQSLQLISFFLSLRTFSAYMDAP